MPACDIADDAESCADRISALLGRSPEERRARARMAVLDGLGWPARLQPMLELFAELDHTRRSATP